MRRPSMARPSDRRCGKKVIIGNNMNTIPIFGRPRLGRDETAGSAASLVEWDQVREVAVIYSNSNFIQLVPLSRKMGRFQRAGTGQLLNRPAVQEPAQKARQFGQAQLKLCCRRYDEMWSPARAKPSILLSIHLWIL